MNVLITSVEEFKKRLLELQQQQTNLTTLPSKEPRFTINADTREITVPKEFNFLAVRGDHKAETIYFEIDRYFDDTDLSQHTCIMQFTNLDDKDKQYVEGIDQVTEFDVESIEGKIVFGWNIKNDVTRYAGNVAFSVRFYSIDAESQMFTYNFNTTSKTLPVLDTLSVIDYPSFIEPSILTYWEDRMLSLDRSITNEIENFSAEMARLSETTKGYRDSTKTTYDNVIAKSTEINTTITTGVTSLQNKSNEQVAIIGQKGIDTLATIPEDYTQIDADVEHLKKESVRYPSRFANALIATVEGEGQISVTDAWDAPVVSMEISGRSEQVVTTGAQLFDASRISNKVNSGITLTNNKDGSFTFNGTASGYAPVGEYEAALKVNVNYTVGAFIKSGSVSGDELKSFRVRVIPLGSTTEIDYYIGTTFSIKNETDSVKFLLQIETGYSCDNLVIFPMINEGDNALPWEPYTGGIPSPNPEYPQAIKGVEHVVNSGSQLFDASKIKAIEVITNVITNTIEVAGSASRAKAAYEIDISKVNGRTLYVSGMIVSKTVADAMTVIVLCIQNADDSWTYKTISTVGTNQTVSTEVPIDAKCVRLDLNVNDTISALTTTNSAVFKNVMVSIDSAQPWEPYNGQQRETDLQVAVTGKNLFAANKIQTKTDGGATVTNNADGSFTITGSGVLTKSYSQGVTLTRAETLSLFKPDVYTFSGIKTNPYCLVKLVDGSKILVELNLLHQNSAQRPFTRDMLDNENVVAVLQFFGQSGSTIIPGTVKPMLSADSTAQTWEPYYEPQSVTIPLAEPLHGIGDVRDRIVYKDGVWGVERQFKKFVFNGSEKWELNLKPNNKMRYKLRDATIMPFDINVNACVMCDAYISRTAVETHAGKQGIAVDDVPNILIYDESVSDENTIDRFKAQLQTNPINAIFQSKSPVWEPFPAETQTTLNALTTYPGTTYLTVAPTDVAATVKIEYVQDTQKVIEGLQTAIQNLLNAASNV